MQIFHGIQEHPWVIPLIPESGTSQDPYLGARLARQFVKGVQGQGVMTVLPLGGTEGQ